MADYGHVWELLENAGDAVARILLWGPPGTGKTYYARRLAERLQRPLFNITLCADIMAQEVIGHYVPRGSEFIWSDGPALRAWRSGGLLCLNEIDQASGAVLAVLLAILDDPASACLVLPTGETVKPGSGFMVVATTNAAPDVLPDALRDRFDIIVNIQEPHPNALETLPEDLREHVLNAYRSVAEGSRDGLAVTFREARAYAQLRRVLPEPDAAFLVWGDRGEDVLAALRIGTRPRG